MHHCGESPPGFYKYVPYRDKYYFFRGGSTPIINRDTRRVVAYHPGLRCSGIFPAIAPCETMVLISRSSAGIRAKTTAPGSEPAFSGPFARADHKIIISPVSLIRESYPVVQRRNVYRCRDPGGSGNRFLPDSRELRRENLTGFICALLHI